MTLPLKPREACILSLLRHSEGPMTAYEILGAFRPEEPEIAPPTVYRALANLQNAGLIHKLESQKAFMACKCEHDADIAVFATCEDCGRVEEFDGGSIVSKMNKMTAQSGFTATRHVYEIQGKCNACA